MLVKKNWFVSEGRGGGECSGGSYERMLWMIERKEAVLFFVKFCFVSCSSCPLKAWEKSVVIFLDYWFLLQQ